MSKLRIHLVLTLMTVAVAGCAASKSGDVYTREQARREMTVRTGVVESVRPVLIEGTKSPVGASAGAIVGGIAGATIGRGRGSTVGSVIGALGGGLAGAAIEEQATRKEGIEITVRLDDGSLRAYVQEATEAFNPGERVRVLSGAGEQRVTH